MSSHDQHHDSCPCAAHSNSTAQSITELEWERGIWPAAREGDFARVQHLLQKHEGIACKRDKAGYAAGHYAARAGMVEVLRELLNAGAEVDARTTEGMATPMMRAAYMGRRECVELLIQRKANVELQDADGQTALHKAAENGKRDVAVVLLKAAGTRKKELLAAVDSKGRTAKDVVKAGQDWSEVWE